MKSHPVLLAIDFDQTIAKTSPYPHIQGLRKGAKKYINRLIAEGYHVTIWTCRTDEPAGCTDASDARRFLHDAGVWYHQFNDNHRALQNRFENNCRKVSADIYIDDKGLWPFGFPSWFWLYWLIRLKTCFMKHKILSMCEPEHF